MRCGPHNPYLRPKCQVDMPDRPRNAICLVIDGLHAGYLGAYGNTWLATPHWDRLACEAVVFDSAFVDTPQVERLYRSYWLGLHAGCLAPNRLEPPPLSA